MAAVSELIWTGSYGSTTIDQICGFKSQSEPKPGSGSMMKRMLIMLAPALLLIAAIGAWELMRIRDLVLVSGPRVQARVVES